MKVVEQKNKNHGKCPCCGYRTKISMGVVEINEGHDRSYLARWTPKKPDDGMAFLISTSIEGGVVSVLYSFEHESFMVVGTEDNGWEIEEEFFLLERDEVIGTPLAKEIFAILDVIWVQDRGVKKFQQKWIR